MANTINSVTLSTYSLNLQNGMVGSIKATVDCSDINSNEKVSVIVSDTDYAEFYGQSRKEDGDVDALNPNDNILYFKAKHVGNTTAIIKSVTDPTKYAILDIDIYMSNVEDVTLSEKNIWVEKGGSYPTDIVATVVARYGVDTEGVTLEYSIKGIARVTMLRRPSQPDKTWLSVSGINDGVTKVKVKSKSDPTAGETLTVTVGKGIIVDRIKLDETSVVVAVGQVVQVSAEVVTSSGVDRDGVGWKTSGSPDSIIIHSTSFINQDGTYTKFLNIKGKKPGYTKVHVYAKNNPAVYEYIDVRVVENESDTYPTATILVEPTSITVPLNTEFTINGSAIFSDGGKQSSSQYETIIDWSSSDNSIVSVIGDGHSSNNSNCRFVSGSTPGTTTVIARYSQDPYSYASCTVTVRSNDSQGTTDPVENPVDTVTLNKSSLRLAVGASYQLKATVKGVYSIYAIDNPNVNWYTNDDNIASVNSDGRVYGFSEGVTVITVRSDQNPAKAATCTVTVYSASDGDDIGEEETNGLDTIIRVDYNEDGSFSAVKLFEGDLNLSAKHPIESVVYHETEDIQKIYWVDGRNVLRFMNFMAEPDSLGRYPWQNSNGVYDPTYFDSNRIAKFNVDVTISKSNSGNTRANGVAQYLLTYYNDHGQETGYIWISDLVYLSPVSSGGAADGTNNNSVVLSISNLDERFTHFRVYSIFRSSINGTTTAYIVSEGSTSGGEAVVTDDAAHLTSVDASSLLYLGSQDVRAGTLTHKDQTLFLGDLQSIGKGNYDELEQIIRDTMFSDYENGISDCIEFIHSVPGSDVIGDIPSEDGQLKYTSSQILSFKGGEKYRFALSFKREDGTDTEAFWVGDAVNTLYPSGLTRVVAKCTLSRELVIEMRKCGFKTATLMIAEATYADRSVKAQGIINPTVFNVWNRYNDKLYASASWMSRPRGGNRVYSQTDFSWKHFTPIKNSTYSSGEIECNYWTGSAPYPYYRFVNYTGNNKAYSEEFDGIKDFDYYMVLYCIQCWYPTWYYTVNHYSGNVTIITAKLKQGGTFSDLNSYNFDNFATLLKTDNVAIEKTIETDKFIIGIYHQRRVYGSGSGNPGLESAYNTSIDAVHSQIGRDNIIVPDLWTTYDGWSRTARDNRDKLCYFNLARGSSHINDDYLLALQSAANAGGWYSYGQSVSITDSNYTPSYYKKHLMFVDENVITLNSPEFDYEAVSLDNAEGCKFRIVGIAKIAETNTDYVVNATPGKLAGENLIKEKFSKPSGIISWPMWKEYGLNERTWQDDGTTVFEHTITDYPSPEWTSDDYMWGGNVVYYWLHMWNHPGSITTFNGGLNRDDEKYSVLQSKTFANERYCNSTIYQTYGANPKCDYYPDSVRMFNYLSSQYVRLNIGGRARYYDAVIQESLSLPSTHKYPILYSNELKDTTKAVNETNAYLYSNTPIQIEYTSSHHAVIALHTNPEKEINSNIWYEQEILPALNGSIHETINNVSTTADTTGALIPWENVDISGASYPYKNYRVKQESYNLANAGVTDNTKYFYIGEIYYPFGEGVPDTRYGGVTKAAVQSCRFIPAGPQYIVDEMMANGGDVMYANQGDTYFQRWECLKTKPYSTDAVNNVIDVTSVVLETHINVEGRTDQQRKSNYLASIDTEKFNSINPVYSQTNNFIVQRDLDDDFNLDSYRSSITWTLEKHDSEDVDAWTHITLANTLKLDGDKGICQALRRFNNTIIAFQDRGISEILFNSRTQLTTTDGVPVEIANSGKVDGKRYITNKYGTTNKWSIVEGKSALYFVDSMNKAFCAFNGQGIDNLSTRLGFGAWFREINDRESWKPLSFNNIVSYYDKVHSDIYLVRGTEEDPCLVYNENLGAFTSFFDYGHVLMMTNVEDRFISFKNHALWLQNEGLYGNFFGQQYGFWTQYRVTPDPYLDKIWTNIDYRADFYQVLDGNGDAIVPEEYLINGDIHGELADTYKEWETFTDYRVWNEYQNTGFTPFAHEKFDRDDVRKKFRIWRLAIPRALRGGTNIHGMDRIRNPWINLLFRKENQDGKNLMQLHDIVVKYFE